MQTLMNVLKILMAALRHAQTQLEATLALAALAIAWEVMGMDVLVSLMIVSNTYAHVN